MRGFSDLEYINKFERANNDCTCLMIMEYVDIEVNNLYVKNVFG